MNLPTEKLYSLGRHKIFRNLNLLKYFWNLSASWMQIKWFPYLDNNVILSVELFPAFAGMIVRKFRCFCFTLITSQTIVKFYRPSNLVASVLSSICSVSRCAVFCL